MSTFNVLGTVLANHGQCIDLGFCFDGSQLDPKLAPIVVQFGINENSCPYGLILKQNNPRDAAPISSTILIKGAADIEGRYDLLPGIEEIITMLSIMEDSLFSADYRLEMEDGRNYVFTALL